ncbi:hypothetical protein NP233_g9378 [Leucocoprinus birnbaumii]|uniref:Uncharacterized protein n=1 Tax=Leucocoprinus birnbaumii TaxID=56174 RepID=A0AAD5VKP9_9AGAR|nr:hypothetical protein NP233_g9378 [Leucocoprinus birnbaumii]
MALGILLFTFVAAANGGPITGIIPHAGDLTADDHPALSLFGRQLPECIQPGRWIAIRLNLPGPHDSGFQRFKRSVVIAIMAVIGPEFIAFFATRQGAAAARIKKEFNEKFNGGVDPTVSVVGSVRRWFTGTPIDEGKKGWTMTHGFFVQMGGFMMCRDGKPVQVLTFGRLLKAIDKGEIDVPHIPEEEILARSTSSSGITMLIMVLQTTWFIAQCISRWASHLPLAEFEVFTLALIAVNAYIWVFWASKPRGVIAPIRLELRSERQGASPSKNDPTPSTFESDITSIPLSPISLRVPSGPVSHEGSDALSVTTTKYDPDFDSKTMRSMAIGKADGQHENNDISQNEMSLDKNASHWVRNQVNNLASSPFESTCSLIAYTPFLLFVAFQYPFRVAWKTYKNLDSKVFPNGKESVIKFKVGQLRVPMFYADSGDDTALGLTTLFIPPLFGGIHLILWSAFFHTQREQLLWRVAALYITLEPVMFIAAGGLVSSLGDTGAAFIGGIAGLSIAAYAACRGILIYICFYTLAHLPDRISQDISWTSLVPHI